jgi:hypothetical protein
MKSPAEILIEADGSEIKFFAILHMVELLIEAASPLPVRLRDDLAPWIAESRRRRLKLRVEARESESRHAVAGGARI